MSNAAHTWYPQNDPLEGDPESADVLAILHSLHTSTGTWADKYLTAEDQKSLRKES